MFGIRRLKYDLQLAQKKAESANFTIHELSKYISTFKPVAIEDELIAYCRVFGKRIKIETPDESYVEEYFENAILFPEPIIIKQWTPLIGICYNPKYDTFDKNGKSNLLLGRHLGLEGIVSLSYLCGDESEYKPWAEFGPIVLNRLRENYKL